MANSRAMAYLLTKTIYDQPHPHVDFRLSSIQKFKKITTLNLTCLFDAFIPDSNILRYCSPESDIEDLTLVIILYEIYETSLRRVSSVSYVMTTSVRFCLSYDPLKWNFTAFKTNIISIRKQIVDTNVVNDVTCTRQSVTTRVVIRFLGHTLST